MTRVGAEVSGDFWKKLGKFLLMIVMFSHVIKACAIVTPPPGPNWDLSRTFRATAHGMDGFRRSIGVQIERFAQVCPSRQYGNCRRGLELFNVVTGLY